MPLADTTAIVTGGSRGIGLALSTTLAEMGALVVITGRDEACLQQAAGELAARGLRAAAITCDVTSLASVEALGERLRHDYHRVDILINNAGIGGPPGPLHELAPTHWDAILDTNLRGVYYMLRAVVPLMIAAGAGHIINISSLAGKNPLPGGAAYSASKWALNGLSYAVAEELRAQNIRVSVICPGSVDTGFSPRRHGKQTGKMLQPSDIAHVVAALVTQAPQSFFSEVLLRPAQKP